METSPENGIYEYVDSTVRTVTGATNVSEKSTIHLIMASANRYVLPLIIVTGFFGNLLSFLVFVFSRLKRISTSVYLAALAVSDSGFLLCVGIGWLDAMGIPFFHNEGICHVLVYITFVFSFTSIWFVNAFTTEMYIAAFHPQKSVKMCTVSYARKVVAVLTGFAVLFYIFTFWTTSIVKREDGTESCSFHPSDKTTMMVLSMLDTVFTLMIPFSMIIFMSGRLLFDIKRLYRRGSEADTNSTSGESETTTAADNTLTSARQANKAQTKLMRMLVVVILVFLVLNLPSHVMRLQFFIRSMADSWYQTTELEVYLQQIFLLLNYVNFSINVVLYSACAKSFRKALCSLLLLSCQQDCSRVRNCFNRFIHFHKHKSTESNRPDEMDPHSRLVEIHLSEIHLSQIPSFDTEYICRSPPCLISGNTENTNL